MSYYNMGTGYSCGGSYLWLNGIYIREGFRRKGHGSQLLAHIENYGRERGITLFVCSRDAVNEASRHLFAKAGFQQSESISMSKTYT